MPSGTHRVQFVVSGPFLFLLLLSTGLTVAGFWLYTHPPPPVVVKAPPFYVNRVATALRPCSQCMNSDGTLKEKQKWKLGRTVSIPNGEQWWFASISDSAEPITIDRVPMLAVHPAINKDAPWEGFDQRKIFFVVAQDLDPRTAIEHPAPPPPPPTPEPPRAEPESKPPDPIPATPTESPKSEDLSTAAAPPTEPVQQ